jgi:hypothetical protein
MDVGNKIPGSAMNYRALSIDAKVIHNVESTVALADLLDVAATVRAQVESTDSLCTKQGDENINR